MTGKKSLITLNMCDFCSHERSDCGAQPVLVDSLNLDNMNSDQNSSEWPPMARQAKRLACGVGAFAPDYQRPPAREGETQNRFRPRPR